MTLRTNYFDTAAVRERLQPNTVPYNLVHELDVLSEAIPTKENRVTERLGAVAVGTRKIPVLSAPLAGENYVERGAGRSRRRPTAGDAVKRGDVIGRVGNSGNTTAPHLHFHVMDGPSPLAAQGVPYVYDRFTGLARSAVLRHSRPPNPTVSGVRRKPEVPTTEHANELVMDLNIVTFTP